MRNDLKQRRLLSYSINEWDDVNLEYDVDFKRINQQVIKFFKTESKLVYPAKSIFVAIVYAKVLEELFNIPFYELLDDEELLPDDKYFKEYTYSRYKKGYDYILLKIGNVWKYPSIEKTIAYCKKEFLVDL